MPVGTRASVKAIDSVDLEAVGAEVVFGNTYHLMLRPGVETVAAFGGLGEFSGWRGHTLTDSGGFQVFSLHPSVDDDGVTFRSTYDGSSHRLTPESAVAIQARIGADIQMVLDVCPPLPSEPAIVRTAVERTARWAERARQEPLADGQALFGIVQGGVDPTLRAEAAQRTCALDFDGYGIGGLSVGEPRPEMLVALEATMPELPTDRPRYLMGVGDPIGIVESVARGVDMFDCVLPTRLAPARHRADLHRALPGEERQQRPLGGRDRCLLFVWDLSALLAGLYPAFVPGRRAVSGAAAHDPQPHLAAHADGAHSGSHRTRHLCQPARRGP